MKEEVPTLPDVRDDTPTVKLPARSNGELRLADGVELLGEYEGSGFKEPRYMARRPDGEMIQLTQLLYFVAEEIDGRSDYDQIAERVSERYGRTVTADNVKTLVDKNLAVDGFIAGHDGQPRPKKVDPLLALKFKFTLLPEGAVNFFAALLRPLFWPPVVIAVLAGFIALDVWYFAVHGIGQSLRDLIYQPLLVLMVYGLLILSIGWHELGHATACRYGGARPGRIGFGIYIVWPAFFTDVTDALKLGKGGRVRTDLGGIYFNTIFSLAIGGIYLLTGFEPILVLIVMQHLLILYNLMPFLRLDGYHAISDITGIPDLFARIKPTVKGLVPGQDTPSEVAELKPWARSVVTAWVLITVPVIIYFFAMMVLSLPRVTATGWDSLLIQWDRLQGALDDGETATAAVGGLQAAFIVLPATGMFVSLSRVGKRIATGYWRFTSERPLTRVLLGTVGVAAIGAAVFLLLPNGEYKPIQPDERWTIAEGIDATTTGFASGRPSLSEEREAELGGAPTLNDTDPAFVPSYSDESDIGTTDVTSEDSSEEDTTTEEDTTEEDTTSEEEVTEEETVTPSPTVEESTTP
jgi:putative peptide zinc metalloprotease protein